MAPFGWRSLWKHSVEAPSERLQQRAPRALEVVSALVLAAIALEFVSEVVFAEWFYFRYHRDYAYTLGYRIYEWIYGLCVLLLAAWMLVLAWNLVRGTSGRGDRGLFGTRALRVWGVIFALVPPAVFIASPGSLLHLHMLLWFWGAAIACFSLAARRGKPEAKATASFRGFPEGPPPPIE